jgi:hypothetical protein
MTLSSTTLVGRGILHVPLVLSGHMTADQTTAHRTDQTMMAGIVTGDAADKGALDAPFGIGRYCRCRECHRQREPSE